MVWIQKGIKQMPHLLEVPVSSFDRRGRHRHQCEYCEKEALCQDTFYVRHREIGDTLLCRRCCEDPKMQRIFKALKHLLELGSNVSDRHGVYQAGLEIKQKAKVAK